VKETIQAQDTLISKDPKTAHLSPKSFLLSCSSWQYYHYYSYNGYIGYEV